MGFGYFRWGILELRDVRGRRAVVGDLWTIFADVYRKTAVQGHGNEGKWMGIRVGTGLEGGKEHWGEGGE